MCLDCVTADDTFVLVTTAANNAFIGLSYDTDDAAANKTAISAKVKSAYCATKTTGNGSSSTVDKLCTHYIKDDAGSAKYCLRCVGSEANTLWKDVANATNNTFRTADANITASYCIALAGTVGTDSTAD